jgi:uncharacterized protein YggE
MRNKIYIIAGLLALALVLGAWVGVGMAQDATPTAVLPQGTTPARTVTVSGNGKVYLSPDIAYVSIGVHTEGKDAAETVSSNKVSSQKVADTLKELGIDAKDVQTTNFSIYPQQEYDAQGKVTGIKYVVENTVYVTVRDLARIGDLLDKVVSAGANSINSVQFDVADRSAALKEARKQAVADARSQADELASAAGVSLGAVQSITVSGASTPVPIAYGKGGAAMSVADASVPISPGQMTVTIDVTIVYEIR